MPTFQVTQPHPARRLNVIGVPGEGKSVFRERFLSPIYRVTLANPMGDYNVGDIMTTDEYGKNVNTMRRGLLRVTVAPTSWDPEAMLEEFDALSAYVEEVGAQHFGVEEISLYRGEDGLRIPGNFQRLCVKGRHRAISMSVYGQRFHQFPLITRGTASEIVAFAQADPEDVRDFNKRIHPDVAPIPLNQLPEHHFLHWTRQEGVELRAPLPLDSNSLDSPVLMRGLRAQIVSETFQEEG